MLSGVAVVLVTIFFITSADSGAFVMDMIAHRGDTNPPRITRIFWASASGVIAAALLWAGASSPDPSAGMSGLQALALLSALPFSVVMIGMCISIWRSLYIEVKMIERLELRMRQRAFIERWGNEITDSVSDSVQARMEDQVSSEVQEQVAAQITGLATGEITAVVDTSAAAKTDGSARPGHSQSHRAEDSSPSTEQPPRH